MPGALNIMGIRGVPAAHGGFEVFAHNLAPFLVERGWDVTVYCQHDAHDPATPEDGFEDEWQGVRRVHFRAGGKGPASTITFDFRCTRDVLKRPGIDLVLGYNTAVFSLLQRLARRKVVMNMDGLEWKREKWNFLARAWLWGNEIVGAHGCTLPVADHPEIARHLERHWTRGIEVIPYGSSVISDAPADAVRAMGLEPGEYLVSIARPEPENSTLELVQAFSRRKRGMKLVVLAHFVDDNPYHRKIFAAASDEVLFAGAIFDPQIVDPLRFHACAYLHGHRVGGTNPSLVEALGAGMAIVAHDNRFNRWVAGEGQFYFRDEETLEACLQIAMRRGAEWQEARKASRVRHAEDFSLDSVHERYADLLERVLKS